MNEQWKEGKKEKKREYKCFQVWGRKVHCRYVGEHSQSKELLGESRVDTTDRATPWQEREEGKNEGREATTGKRQTIKMHSHGAQSQWIHLQNNSCVQVQESLWRSSGKTLRAIGPGEFAVRLCVFPGNFRSHIHKVLPI